MSGGQPGTLRLLARMIGGWLYAVLVSFGWQPREQREKPPAERM